jgi:hypothetical protein
MVVSRWLLILEAYKLESSILYLKVKILRLLRQDLHIVLNEKNVSL